MGKTFKRKARVANTWARHMRHVRDSIKVRDMDREHPAMRGAMSHWDGRDMADHVAEMKAYRDSMGWEN